MSSTNFNDIQIFFKQNVAISWDKWVKINSRFLQGFNDPWGPCIFITCTCTYFFDHHFVMLRSFNSVYFSYFYYQYSQRRKRYKFSIRKYNFIVKVTGKPPWYSNGVQCIKIFVLITLQLTSTIITDSSSIISIYTPFTMVALCVTLAIITTPIPTITSIVLCVTMAITWKTTIANF